MPSLAKPLLLVFIALVFSSPLVYGQDAEKETVEKRKKPKSPQEQLAQRAALKSTLIPGWGQWQNGGSHRLKIPVIYGALGTIGYFTFTNHQRYKCYEKAYRLDSKGLYGNCEGFTTNAQLKDGTETYHKQRDMFVLISLGAYALNILDAYVWAHLQDFDNSDDLTLNIYPSFINIANRQYARIYYTTESAMNIGLIGYGKMGREIEKIALERGHQISAKISRAHQLPELLTGTDVAIDFSVPNVAVDNLKWCFDHKLPIVMGTTGWYDQFDEVVKYCQGSNGRCSTPPILALVSTFFLS